MLKNGIGEGRKGASLLFFGSDRFSLGCLKKIIDSNNYFDKINVVSSSWRNKDFVEYCQRDPSLNFKVIPPKCLSNSINDDMEEGKGGNSENSSESNQIFPEEFDFGAVASFGGLLPLSIINRFKISILNAHPSFLPQYRGASPIQYAIKNQDKETAVSIIGLSEKFDQGPIYFQEEYKIEGKPFFHELSDSLAEISGKALMTCFTNWQDIKNNSKDQLAERKGRNENEKQISMAKRIQKSNAKISFKTQTSNEIYALFRAIGHQENLWVDFRDKTVMFYKIQDPDLYQPINLTIDQTNLSIPGAIYYEKINDSLFVRALDRWLPISQGIRVQGKSSLFSLNNFINDYRVKECLGEAQFE